MEDKTLKITINGTGFAADYSAQCYGMIPHKNGVAIELAGVTSGRIANAEAFAEKTRRRPGLRQPRGDVEERPTGH